MNVMAATSTPPQSVELYFETESKQIVTESGKNRIKLGAFQSAVSLEQKKSRTVGAPQVCFHGLLSFEKHDLIIQGTINEV